MRKTLLFFMATLVLMTSVVVFSSETASATTVYKTYSQVVSRIDKAVNKGKESVTIYADPSLNVEKELDRVFFSLNNNKIIGESQKRLGDYYREDARLWLMTWDEGIVTVNGVKAHKYEIDVSFVDSSPKKEKFVTKYCNKHGKIIKQKASKKKGTAQKKEIVRLAALHVAKNMRYKDLKNGLYYTINHKNGVCRNYAMYFYRLVKASGMEARFVTGGDHAWCIVKIGKKWYGCDPTWADKGSSIDKRWLLKGTSDKGFTKTHPIGKEYKTKAFKKACPMAKGSLRL